jgi:hypothetical protein
MASIIPMAQVESQRIIKKGKKKKKAVHTSHNGTICAHSIFPAITSAFKLYDLQATESLKCYFNFCFLFLHKEK